MNIMDKRTQHNKALSSPITAENQNKSSDNTCIVLQSHNLHVLVSTSVIKCHNIIVCPFEDIICIAYHEASSRPQNLAHN